MSGLSLILRELRDNGPATSREIAEAIARPPKQVSTYCIRLWRSGRINRGRKIMTVSKRDFAEGRPAFLWEPLPSVLASLVAGVARRHDATHGAG